MVQERAMPKLPSRFGFFILFFSSAAFATGAACHGESASALTPVIELYTSEGCSSCPPSDQWLSSLKEPAARGEAVVEAFHVGYWDNLGWVDRFASPANTERQRQIAALNRLGNIYTPQLVRNGKDWRDALRTPAASERSAARIVIERRPDDAFEASVAPVDPAARWSAYWTVTEHGHSSKVKAGENSGEFLQHDFVVRQYVPAGDYQGVSKLLLRAVPGTPGHARQVNLVVFDKASGKPLQALSVGC
jgi:hypothetical protein